MMQSKCNTMMSHKEISEDVVTPTESFVVLDIRHVTKQFPLGGGKVLTACNDISLPVKKGKTLGIIGESGCGKSTLVRTLLQMHPATAGEAIYQGVDIMKLTGEALRQSRQHIQMIFQDPGAAFNPKLLVKDIICEPLINFGRITKSEVDQKARELLSLVELPEEFKDRYPHSMSGGQRQRLGIARALSLEPDVIICDEVTSALDVSVQETICQLLARLQKEKGLSYLFICHDLALVDMMSHQIAVMYLGNVVEYLEDVAFDATTAKHPYTQALLKSVFEVKKSPQYTIEALVDDVLSPADIPVGCPFQNRCIQCQDICLREKPLLRDIEVGHKVACHLVK